MTKIIEVVISPAGVTKIQTKGFVGNSCRGASKYLEDALGVQSSERLTAEFYANESTQQTLNERGQA
jgi:hypothetical protein